MRSALVLALVVAVPSFAQKPPARKETPQETFFRLTNEYRQKHNRTILKHNKQLTAAAQKHAENLARQNKWGDDGKNGHVLDSRTPFDRSTAEGYEAFVAENLTKFPRGGSPAGALQSLDGSPPHRSIMLDPRFTELGVGMARSKTGVVIYCQVFGAEKLD
jgi:uncharacterized protein YkwD